MSLQHTDEMRVCWSALCGVNKNKLPSVYCDGRSRVRITFDILAPFPATRALSRAASRTGGDFFCFGFLYFSFEDGASQQLLSAPTRTKENMRLVWHA